MAEIIYLDEVRRQREEEAMQREVNAYLEWVFNQDPLIDFRKLCSVEPRDDNA